MNETVKIEIEPGIEMSISEWQVKPAVERLVDQWLQVHGPIDPNVVRRALCLWIQETAEQMLSDVDWWTGPYSPVDHRFFEILRTIG